MYCIAADYLKNNDFSAYGLLSITIKCCCNQHSKFISVCGLIVWIVLITLMTVIAFHFILAGRTITNAAAAATAAATTAAAQLPLPLQWWKLSLW